MRAFVALGLGIASASAMAQTTVSDTSMYSINSSTYESSVGGLNGQGLSETPTMRANSLAQAKALRAETDVLLRQDGGKLSKVHEAYVRRKTCKILGYERTDTGSLAPRRRCGS